MAVRAVAARITGVAVGLIRELLSSFIVSSVIRCHARRCSAGDVVVVVVAQGIGKPMPTVERRGAALVAASRGTLTAGRLARAAVVG